MQATFTKIIRHKPLIELSYMDIVRLLFGREIEFSISGGESIVVRNAMAYAAFNASAPAVAAS